MAPAGEEVTSTFLEVMKCILFICLIAALGIFTIGCESKKGRPRRRMKQRRRRLRRRITGETTTSTEVKTKVTTPAAGDMTIEERPDDQDSQVVLVRPMPNGRYQSTMPVGVWQDGASSHPRCVPAGGGCLDTARIAVGPAGGKSQHGIRSECCRPAEVVIGVGGLQCRDLGAAPHGFGIDVV